MDLLGNYDSSDDDESRNNDGASPLLPSDSNIQKKVHTTVLGRGTKTPKSNNGRVPYVYRRRGVGKRIVSLHAVLPEAIRDQLSKTTTYDSSSSYESTAGSVSLAQAQDKTPIPSDSNLKKDTGMSSFLSELKSTAPATTQSLQFTTHSTNEEFSSEHPPATSIGLSLTAATTTTSSRKTSRGVLDIHAASSGNGESLSEKCAETGAKSPSLSAVVPLAAAAAPSRRPFNAAPAMAQQQQAHVPMSSQANRTQHRPETSSSGEQHQTKKKNKQQLEKALRSGHFDVVQDNFSNSNVVAIDGQDRSGYNAPRQHEQYQSHGIKKAAVRMYNSSKGGDELQSQITSKHKSKHQINQLVASAVNLEMQRSQQAGIVKQNRRANPKRKYGW